MVRRRRREGGQNEQKGTPLMSFWRCVSSMVLVIVITMPKGVKKIMVLYYVLAN
jgi:hypothetical protein